MAKRKVNIEDELLTINREFEEHAARNKARDLGLPYVDVSQLPLDSSLRRKFPINDWIEMWILPFWVGGESVHLAVVDPENKEVKKVLIKLKNENWDPKTYLATKHGMHEAYERLRGVKQFLPPEDFKNVIDEDKVGTSERELAVLRTLKTHFRGAPSAEILNTILVAGVRLHSTDIHFEPFDEDIRLRFRLDGVLHEAFRFDRAQYEEVATQIKHRGGMKLNVTNVPQDGRFDFEVNEREVDVRVSVIPTEFGDGLVLRLLDSGKKILQFEDLGIDSQNRQIMERAIKKQNGMLVVTGPTGSGKTTTLYAILQKLNTVDRKIITLEDPVEYHLDGVEQSQIDAEHGYHFADGLRAVLRHDPEVVMVGEIRDPETARIAMQAAITGHLVLTTLHTNDTVSTIIRFEQMEIEPYLIAPSLSTVVAQRLVRKVCLDCAGKREITKEERAILRSIREEKGPFEIPDEVPEIRGCEKCSNTGYKGRIGIYEILEVDSEIQQAILGGVDEEGKRVEPLNAPDLYKLAIKKGLITIFADGVSKVTQGVTSIEELLRVLGE